MSTRACSTTVLPSTGTRPSTSIRRRCPIIGLPADVGESRQRLRRVAVLRNRLFQAYLQAEIGHLFVRFGRQILAWGETDVFRLLDNINPLDNSFGGFLVPLDERRVPIDMLRISYQIGEIPYSPFYEAYIEGFAAIDSNVGWNPSIPDGRMAAPQFRTLGDADDGGSTPPETVGRARGGAQLKFISNVPGIETATFAIAHYYTYVDLPAIGSCRLLQPSLLRTRNDQADPCHSRYRRRSGRGDGLHHHGA